MDSNYCIAVIGLGYVGLPLAVEFAKIFCDRIRHQRNRVDELMSGHDHTLEIEDNDLKNVLCQDPGSKGLFCTDKTADIISCNFYIVTVPTPTDKHNNPDLAPLYKASETVGMVLKKGDIVIYESTVYPGVTEEECAPVLEKVSGMKFNVDFFCGYSPERINPGDKLHTVSKILKITSGSTPEVAKKVDSLYRSIIEAGTHMAPSIKVAEAAKVITPQRDINIAFVNEWLKFSPCLHIRMQF
jgi:UDP-N-acetyl-D-galactosamine dehydrogenase